MNKTPATIQLRGIGNDRAPDPTAQEIIRHRGAVSVTIDDATSPTASSAESGVTNRPENDTPCSPLDKGASDRP